MMGTNKYNLPLVSGSASAKVPRDLNALATAVDAAIDLEKTDLNTRVDTLNQTQNVYNGQNDFIEMIKNASGYNRVRFRKRLGNKYEVSVDNGYKHVTYGFLKDVTDDFIKLGKCYVGTIGDAYNSRSYAENLTGSWNTASPPHYYTTTVNDTFSSVIKGSKFLFAHRSDNRGGIWEFVVDGNTSNKVTVSTWSSTDSGSVPIFHEIFSNLSNTSHTIVGTFKGADPANPPTGGIARGWVWSKPSDLTLAPTFQGYVTDMPIEEAQLMTEASNKEIVFNLRYNNVNHWVPEHDNIPVTFNKVPARFLVNDKEVDIGALVVDEWISGSDFKLVQNNVIRFSESPGVDLMEWNIMHAITTAGVVTTTGYAKALQEVRLNIIYALMLPVVYSKLDEVMTGIGTNKLSANDGVDYYPNDADLVRNGCFIASKSPDYIVAGKINNAYKTMRVGKTAKPATALRFWQRTNDPKLYFQPAENLTLVQGESYTWSNTIGIAKINNIYNFVKG